MSSTDQIPPQIPPLPDNAPLHRVETRPYATGRTIMALILREMSTRYGRTPGGYIWAVLEPLGMIIVLSFGFSLLLRSPSLGTSFILFYSTGYLPFNLFNSLSTTTSKALTFSKSLLKYPAVTWVDAILARFILNTLTSIMVMYILLFGIMVVVDSNTVIDFVPIIQAVALAMLLGLGIGTLNCFLTGMFPAYQMAWSIATRPLMLASAVIYIYEDLPGAAQNVLWYNPLAHITGLMRTGFFPTYNPGYLSPVYVASIGLISLAAGVMLLRRHHIDMMNA